MIIIEIQNKTTLRVPVARRLFVLVAERTLRLVVAFLPNRAKTQQWSKGLLVQISLVFVTRQEMRRLNRQYRGKSKPTDVLSFPRFPSVAWRVSSVRRMARLLGRIVPMADPDGVIRLGEIIIAPEVARKEASQFAHTISKHYIFLFVHGLLHLLGYDHERSKKDEREMFSLQKKILSRSRIYR